MELILTDGSSVLYDLVKFDVPSHRFSYYGKDITNLIYRKDKETFTGFDIATDNRRISDEKRTGNTSSHVSAALPDSTAGQFFSQIASDPLAAPLQTLDNTAKKILGSFGIQIIIVVVLLGVFVWAGGMALIKGKLSK